MKYLITFSLLISSFLLTAQNFINRHYDEYVDLDRSTVVQVYGKSFALAANVIPENTEEAKELGEFVASINALNLLVVPDLPNARAEYDRGISVVGRDFEELLRIKESDGRLSLYIDADDDVVYEVVAIGHNDDELVVFSLTGEMRLDLLSSYIGKMNITDAKPLQKLKTFDAEEFAIYPNPVKSGSTLQVAVPSSFDGGKASIIDLNGKILQTFPISGGRQEISINDLAAGSYVVSFEHQDINVQKRVVVVK